MRLEFSSREYFEISVLPQKDGYDFTVLADVTSESFSGNVQGIVECEIANSFIESFQELDSASKLRAELFSSGPYGFTLKIGSIDTLGHFVLQFRMEQPRRFHGKVVKESCTVAFCLDFEQVKRLYKYLSCQFGISNDA